MYVKFTKIAAATIAIASIAWSVGCASKKTPQTVQEIYKMKCSLCHGDKGDKGMTGAFDLTKSTLSDAEIIDVISNGRKTMAPYKRELTPEQIKELATYLKTFRK